MQRQTAALAAAFLLLAIAYFAVEVRGGRDRERARARELALFPIAAGDVVEVRLSGGARLARDAADSRAAPPLRLVPPPGAPPAVPTDSLAAAELLERLLAARWERRLALPRDSLAAYGLAPPRAWGEVRGRDGRAVTIDVGGETPSQTTLYASDREAGRTGIVWRSVARDFATEANALRDRRLVGVAAAQVAAIAVERPSGALSITRGADGGWRLEAPVRGRASETAVSSWLVDLLSLRAHVFLDSLDCFDAAHGGVSSGAGDHRESIDWSMHNAGAIADAAGRLPEPVRRLALLPEGARDSLVLTLAGPASPQGFFLATAPAQPRPVLADGGLADLLDVSADSLRERRLFRHATGEAIAFQVAQGFDTLEAERTRGGEWRIVRPESLEADPIRVRAFLRNLDMEQIAESAQGTSAAARGLEAPRASARLAFETPPVREGILVGAPMPLGGFYGAFEGEPDETLVLPERIIAVLSPDPGAYESMHLLAGPLAAARAMTVALDGRDAARLSRDGEGWVAAKGSVLDDAGAARLAQALAELQPSDRFALMTPDSALGLDAPVLTIEWDGPRAGRFDIGGPLDPWRRFARLRGRRAAYVVDAPLVDSIRTIVASRR